MSRSQQDFNNDSLRKVKSDKADAVKIAHYALDKWQKLKQYSVMDELRNPFELANYLGIKVIFEQLGSIIGYYNKQLRKNTRL